MADEEQEVALRLGLLDDLSRPLDKVIRKADEAFDALERIDRVDLGHIKHEVEELAVAEAVAAREANKLDRALSGAGTSSRRASSDVRAATTDVSRASRDMEQATSRLAQAFGLVDRGLGALSKGLLINKPLWAGVAAGAGLLATTLGSVGAGSLAAVGGIAPLVGLMAPLGAGALALVSSMGVLKLGLQGVGKAAGVLAAGGTLKQVQTALKNLTPEARGLALALAEAKKNSIDPIIASIQHGLIPNVIFAVNRLRTLTPLLRQGLGQAGAAVGGVIHRASNRLTSAGFRADLPGIFSTNATVIKDLGDAGISLIGVFKNLYVAAEPMIRTFAGLAEKGANWLDVQTKAGKDSGRLGAFFQRSTTLAERFGRILHDVGGGLFQLSKIGADVFYGQGGMGVGFEQTARKFDTFAHSTAGIQKITSYFVRSKAVLHEVAGIFGEIFKGFARLGSNASAVSVLDKIRTDLVPGVMSLLQTFSSSGGGIGGAIIEIANAFIALNNAIPYSAFATVLTLVAKAMTVFTSAISHAPGPIRDLVGALLLLRGFGVLGNKIGFGGLGGAISGTIARTRGGAGAGMVGGVAGPLALGGGAGGLGFVGGPAATSRFASNPFLTGGGGARFAVGPGGETVDMTNPFENPNLLAGGGSFGALTAEQRAAAGRGATLRASLFNSGNIRNRLSALRTGASTRFSALKGAFAGGGASQALYGAAGVAASSLGAYQSGESGSLGGTGLSVLGGAASGAMIGSLFGPEGTAIGAGLGALVPATTALVGAFSRGTNALLAKARSIDEGTSQFSSEIQSGLQQTGGSQTQTALLAVQGVLGGQDTGFNKIAAGAGGFSPGDPRFREALLKQGLTSSLISQAVLAPGSPAAKQVAAAQRALTASGDVGDANTLAVLIATLRERLKVEVTNFNDLAALNGGQGASVLIGGQDVIPAIRTPGTTLGRANGTLGSVGTASFAGGYRDPGTLLVGELRPEVFVPTIPGLAAQIVGADGPEIIHTSVPGFVLPKVPDERTLANEPARLAFDSVRDGAANSSTFAPVVQVSLTGDPSGLTEADVERAVVYALRKVERQRQEQR